MLKRKLLQTIRKFRMLKPCETVFLAVSGGGDSSVLLHLFLELAHSWKLKLAVLHVNHGLRGKESNSDERFVRALSKKHHLPCYVRRIRIKSLAKRQKKSIEEAARGARYEFFAQMVKAKKADKLVLAHTQDDQAETVLMRIITGTGLQGLQAIRPKRKFFTAELVRPLIEISRAEIRKFAQENKISYRNDESNQSLEMTRNRIRLKLIPFIEKSFNPQVKKALARLPHLLDVDLRYLDETADACYGRLARENRFQIVFSKRSFLELSPAIQYRFIQRAVRKLAGGETDYEHWNQFSGFLTEGRNFKFQFSKNILAQVSRNRLELIRSGPEPVSFSYRLGLDESLYVTEAGKTVTCESLPEPPKSFRKTDLTYEVVDRDLLRFPLVVRSRKPGDRFIPLGQEKSVKLKKFLINRHVPAEEKNRLPLVLSAGEIVWVGGLAVSEQFKVSEKTRRCVRLSIQE